MVLNPDPAIEQIREMRHRISEEHEHDPKKLVSYYVELQKKYQAQYLDETKLGNPQSVQA